MKKICILLALLMHTNLINAMSTQVKAKKATAAIIMREKYDQKIRAALKDNNVLALGAILDEVIIDSKTYEASDDPSYFEEQIRLLRLDIERITTHRTRLGDTNYLKGEKENEKSASPEMPQPTDEQLAAAIANKDDSKGDDLTLLQLERQRLMERLAKIPEEEQKIKDDKQQLASRYVEIAKKNPNAVDRERLKEFKQQQTSTSRRCALL